MTSVITEDYVFSDGDARPDLPIDQLVARLEQAEEIRLPDAYHRLAASIDGRRPVKHKILIEGRFGDTNALFDRF